MFRFFLLLKGCANFIVAQHHQQMLRPFIATGLILFSHLVLPAQAKSVLWLGNSYVATNNLPNLLYQLALSGGDTIQYDSNTPGGYTLQMHSQDANTAAKINQQNWDYVILQAQSQEPSLDTPYVVANVFPYARILDSLIHLNDSCTQTMFYMTWGRKNGDASNCAAYPPVCTYSGMQDQLRNRYLQMGNDNGAIVAPCGEAWRDAIATSPAFDLYMADESHPSLHGSYLNACVFYASIYRRSPVGLTYYGGLPSADAQFLQQVAASCVLDSMSVWNTEVYYDDPSFTSSLVSGTTYSFTATTTGSNHQWNFGSGFVNGNANESYTFPANGTYTVVHVTDNGCYTDTSVVTLLVGPQDVASITNTGFEVYPNPADETVLISSLPAQQEYIVVVFDCMGQVVNVVECAGSTTQINTAHLPEGNYMIQIVSAGQIRVRRISVLHY